MPESDFAALGRMIREQTGIVLNEGKRWMLTLRLTRELRRLGLRDFASYRALLDHPDAGAERNALTSAVTTNVTSFFRGPEQFEAFATLVPTLHRKAQDGGRVRIWSAGCSTGQEPVSIAITLLDHWPEAARADVRILATDIDAKVVATAQAGSYGTKLVAAEVPVAHRHHFTPGTDAEMSGISAQVAGMIRYHRLNLHDPWPFHGMFDAIFCRNVVIYFDAESRRRLWQRLATQLVPGGSLFVGHSERIDTLLHPLLRAEGVTRYRRCGTGGTGVAARHSAPFPPGSQRESARTASRTAAGADVAPEPRNPACP